MIFAKGSESDAEFLWKKNMIILQKWQKKVVQRFPHFAKNSKSNQKQKIKLNKANVKIFPIEGYGVFLPGRKLWSSSNCS